MLKVETSFKLPSEFAVKGSEKTLAQAIRVYEARSHFGLAKVKGRGEVNRTTKKLYKQKGTGGARHGARSAPIFVGGGAAFGPTGLKRKLNLSAALKKNALGVALSIKEKEGKVKVVSGVSTLKATKELASLLKKVDAKETKFVVALATSNMDKARFARNIAGVTLLPYSALNAYIVTFGGTLIVDADSFRKTEVKEVPVKVAKTAKVVKKTTKKVTKKETKK